MQRDQIHPNADGARAIADTIWPYLERLLAAPLTPASRQDS
jgi:lysophospholipase L1-like esterase